MYVHTYVCAFTYKIQLKYCNLKAHIYGTSHVQVYKKTHVTLHVLRNFEDYLHVWLVLHEELTVGEQLLMN